MTLTRSLDYYDEQIMTMTRNIHLMEKQLEEAKDLLEVQSFQIKNEKGIRVAIAIQALWRGYMVRKYTLSREDRIYWEKQFRADSPQRKGSLTTKMIDSLADKVRELPKSEQEYLMRRFREIVQKHNKD